ncbi:ras GTPase-activating protein 2-like [Sinocyclocheilus grahami]|uniref:ras GTPase-activating protein 2-like n=1 Tax=Sinocyclocheilus grahami TaxID=75366 RepID=UPI0007AC6F75|nr:PREDICTED: ras GTPase-activating protein 2-like [Sinocyclocheilus grahami]
MAEEDDTKIRILQSLRGKICEGKNLGPSSGPNRLRDLCTFCTISLDQEEVYRTKVYEKSVSPFYGEDFYFEIPRPFQCLSFYVYAKSMFQIRGLAVGKVAIRKEDLYKYCGKENWFQLQPVDPHSEVQGKVHLEMKLNELITENGSICQQLVVQIIACQGLPLISGQNCDPYATVTLVGPARSDQKKTKVKKKTSDPQFDETFHFEVTRSSSYKGRSHFHVEEEDIEKLEIKVELWNNGNLAQDVFLGETRVSVKILRNDNVHRPISASAAHVLGDICRESVGYEALLPVVRLLLHHNRLLPFLTSVAALELENTQEANTIFRGNSLATRCIDDMMKIVGKSYLTVTLKPVLNEIFESNKTCEIDPVKLKEGDNVEVNKFLDEISSNVSKESSGVEDSFVLKEGEVHKRAQGRKRIGKKNFKKRWLRVTNQELSYHKQKGKEALCVIPVKNILGVEKLEESAFNRKNMFQVIHSEKPLYVQAGNCVETNSWIEVLSQVSRCNPGRLSTFHPSAYVGGSWLCCKELNENTPGCKPCTATVLANIQLDIDCDRETERIFSFFSSNRSRLQKMEDACAGMSVYLGQQEECSAFTIQDPKETFRTIKELGEVLDDLQAQHDSKGALTDEPGTIEWVPSEREL